MCRLVKQKWDVVVTRDQLVALEEKVIKALDFELHYAGPLPFLERYLRIYNLDLYWSDREAYVLSRLARTFCRVLLRSHTYLNLRPSQMAAASLTLAVNVSRSNLAPELGIQFIGEPKLNTLLFENVVSIEMDGVKQIDSDLTCPLKMWTVPI